uniref:Putative inosine-uridine preferring nucleoside hydrolase n=1 Tax=Corethrella appendiculata TaxID=1370023 RepID=U5EW03_9DIPT
MILFLSVTIFVFFVNSNGAELRRVIVDVDAGADDAWAIFALLRSEQKFNIKVEAVVCSYGNADVSNVSQNVLRLLTALNRTDVPIYLGSSERLISELYVNQDTFYGTDGFSDIPFDPNTINLASIKTEHAVIFLHKIFSENPNQIALMTLGPLTNTALLFKMYPTVVDKIKSLHIMGGNRNGVGNVKFFNAEFNFYSDPEAANIVLSKFQKTITILPWETNLRSNLVFSKDWRFNVIGQSTNSNFTEVVKLLNNVESKAFENYTDWLPCDLFVASIFIQPEMISETSEFSASVELSGRRSRGQLMLDHSNSDAEGIKNLKIVDNLDVEKFKNLLEFIVGINDSV